MTSGYNFMAMLLWSSARRSSTAAPSSPAICSSAKTAPGASSITRPANWSPAGRRADAAARPVLGSIESAPAALLPGCLRRLDRHAHRVEPAAGLAVQQAVPARRAEAALEGGQGHLLDRGRQAIADPCQIGERGGPQHYPDAAAAAVRRRPVGRRPQADPGAGEARPVEQLAWVGFAVRRDVGMPDDPVGWDAVTRQDVPAQKLDRRHLRLGKRPVAPFVAGIDDFDADRDDVEIGLALPARDSGVKRP